MRDQRTVHRNVFGQVLYDRYGRYPVSIDPFVLPMLIQVHHIDVEFYEEYWVKEAVSTAQREHLPMWHGKKHAAGN